MNELDVRNIPELPYYVTEALNQLRISLGFAGEDVRSIMITSSIPNEGKSFVTMHLWKMIAEVGNNVLLIDGDLRNSVMRNDYGLKMEGDLNGVVHALAGKCGFNDAVYSTNIPNAYLMPVELHVANPVNLLEGRLFNELLKECREEFDYVLVDSPPIGVVADALTIGPHTDGCLLVVRSAFTPRKTVENSINLLRRSGIPLLGTVLNRADTSKKGAYYYNKYYNYSDYYNEE
jgi:capsular exopolysaccharide synthesis family protein